MRSKFEFSHKPANVIFDRCKVCDLQEQTEPDLSQINGSYKTTSMLGEQEPESGSIDDSLR
jgi:hypothetical protein